MSEFLNFSVFTNLRQGTAGWGGQELGVRIATSALFVGSSYVPFY